MNTPPNPASPAGARPPVVTLRHPRTGDTLVFEAVAMELRSVKPGSAKWLKAGTSGAAGRKVGDFRYWCRAMRLGANRVPEMVAIARAVWREEPEIVNAGAVRPAPRRHPRT